MVYMHFPTHLTEEEELLQKKYVKLRKKRQALKERRAPKPEPAQPAEEAKKRSYERAADATEEAKKLLKSGIIKLGTDRKEHREFKRTKRQKDTDRSAVGFQPFQASIDHEEVEDEKPDTPAGGRAKNVKNLYDSFVTSREPRFEPEEERRERPDRTPRDREERPPREREDRPPRDREDRPPRDREDRPPRRDRRDSEREAPKKGNTIYVYGHGLAEELVRRAFSNFGTLVNISMEQDKNCSFVTFEKMESADEAISEMDGSMLSGVQLKVSMARRQPTFEQSVDPSSASWAAIAASSSQKGNHKDKREMISYDVDDIF